jgi:hypothetical protein
MTFQAYLDNIKAGRVKPHKRFAGWPLKKA